VARSCALTNRTGDVELPPVVVSGALVTPRAVELLSAESGDDAWRIVELFSLSGLPFDVDLAWSSGGGSGVSARVTVAKAARVGVHARSLRLTATNHAPVPNRVGCTVADGFSATRNQLEHRATHLETANPSRVPIPPFAERVRVDLGEPHPSARLRLRDALGRVRSLLLHQQQPADGLLVGGAASLELEETADFDFRAVFTLSL